MASGPCGFFFKEAFGCFHRSKAEQKGNPLNLNLEFNLFLI